MGIFTGQLLPHPSTKKLRRMAHLGCMNEVMSRGITEDKMFRHGEMPQHSHIPVHIVLYIPSDWDYGEIISRKFANFKKFNVYLRMIGCSTGKEGWPIRFNFHSLPHFALPLPSKRDFLAIPASTLCAKACTTGSRAWQQCLKRASSTFIVINKLNSIAMTIASVFIPVAIAFAVIIFLSVFFHFVPFFLWLSARVSGVKISLIQLFMMRIRNVPPNVIVPSLIEAHKAGLSYITRDNLEAHYMTGGHVQRVVHALVSASKADIDLSFEKATAIDLAGRDVFEAVQTSVNPKVIDTPPVAAVAKNGIQLIAKARVTVRANIHQLVGGAGEDTILARVGEGIVSSIGSATSHEEVLENPDSISKLVLRKGLDAGTAYEILSIDIADIDVGKNIGATLQIDQANADKNIAQAKAEERRAMAVAQEQEMKALAQQARAEVIQAEADVPKALAQALRDGNMGFMDYYKLENLKGDTAMRDTISKINPNDILGKK